MKYVIGWPPTDTYRNTGKRNYYYMMNMRPFQLDIHGKRNYPFPHMMLNRRVKRK